MSHLVALLSGLIFGLGLLLSGMNDPEKVRAFLDIAGNWRPELLAVMGSAVVIFALVYRVSLGKKQPWFSSAFHTPSISRIDLRLVSGAVLFGIGWGLVGLCPGPALVDLFAFDPSILIFVAALLVGNRLAHWLVGPVQQK
ncbi:MAG: DUF6691 family protein [Thalassolituus sp.]|uniref:YeeE/YedE family protein n=1 Tax=Thalassolituus oleivorans MIL-1 TaxID=1298593 RepID=M5DUM7_9GAMM|nr:DUF6691 family protein [Thalassolituus oleivorans]AHK16747.1 sulfur transport [Thalassolituus oleivorans R6-15]MCA6126478.1 membrane protein [Thalassolituus oleivorans 4BN06-13]CCU73566.1 hypothetical protein TOL_3170 [Thalassolituus oleivorans MIL-1]